MIRDFDVQFDNAQAMDVSFSERDELNVDFGPGVPIGDYEGAYQFTPSSETQIIETRNKTLEGDITINPIPSNYGLITWDGSTITVS